MHNYLFPCCVMSTVLGKLQVIILPLTFIMLTLETLPKLVRVQTLAEMLDNMKKKKPHHISNYIHFYIPTWGSTVV